MEEVARHFRDVLAVQDERFAGLCQHWDEALEQGRVPATRVGAVFTVVGQAQLLQRERFRQFAQLVDQFRHGTGAKPITADDLDGFWDMVYLQVGHTATHSVHYSHYPYTTT